MAVVAVAGRRDASIEGLRGVAALAVVGAHLARLALGPKAPLGAVGVLVFFVLSGYLIARIVARGVDAPDAYRMFLRRRAVRLGPAVLALAILAPVLLVASQTVDLGEGVREAGLVISQTSAFAAAHGERVHAVLFPTWSLTVEWTFYLLFPIWIFVLARRGRSVLMLARQAAIGAVVLYLAGLLIEPLWFYVLPVANLGVMLLGASLGLAHHSGWRGPQRLRLGIWPGGGLVMILALAVLPTSSGDWDYKLAVLPATTIAAVLVINGCVAGHLVRRLLSTKFLTLVGVRAYSLYLWNLPVLFFLWEATGSASWPRIPVAIIILAVVVEASYRLFEVPVLRGGTNALRPAADERAAFAS